MNGIEFFIVQSAPRPHIEFLLFCSVFFVLTLVYTMRRKKWLQFFEKKSEITKNGQIFIFRSQCFAEQRCLFSYLFSGNDNLLLEKREK
ncbi:MAG: hypothetical protein CW335_00020 [Clostridiales bacterium]|nr:hypothetical protein [Clostridiales bacterium]